jgi:hypothetical protein
MNLTQLIDKLWTFIVGLVRSTQTCLGDNYAGTDCSMIWKVSILTAIVVAGGVILLIVRRIVRDYLRYRAAIKRWKADQVVAPEEVMNEVRWQGDQAKTETRSQQELAAQIKEALRHNREAST